MEWLIGSLIIFGAAVIQGITGFGFGIVATPLLFLFYDPHVVVIIVITLSTFYFSIFVFQVWKTADRAVFVPLVMGSLPGLPAGIWLYMYSHVDVLKIITGFLVISFALVLLLVKQRVEVKREKPGLFIAGTISGAMTTSIAINGPPIILFFQNQRYPKDKFRSNLVVYFFFVCPISLVVLYYTGAPPANSLPVSFSYIPSLLIGFWLGVKIYPQVSVEWFRKITIYLLVLSGLTLMGFTLFSQT